MFPFILKCKTEAPLSTANGSFISEAPLYKEIKNKSSDDIVLEKKSESSLYEGKGYEEQCI